MEIDRQIYSGSIGSHTRLRLGGLSDIDPAIRFQIFGDYLENVIEMFNSYAPRELQLNRLPANPMRAAMLRPYLNSTAVTDLCEMTLRGTPHEAAGYFLFPDKMQAVIDIFLALEAGRNKVAFDAETQWGKTIVLIMVFLLRNLWLRSLDKQPEIIMLFGLPRNAPDDQTSEDRKAATLLHGVLSFCGGSPAYDLKNATDQHQNLLISTIRYQDADNPSRHRRHRRRTGFGKAHQSTDVAI